MCHAYYYFKKCQGQKLGIQEVNPPAASPILCITGVLIFRNEYRHGVGYGENSCLWGGGASMWLVQV